MHYIRDSLCSPTTLLNSRKDERVETKLTEETGDLDLVQDLQKFPITQINIQTTLFSALDTKALTPLPQADLPY